MGLRGLRRVRNDVFGWLQRLSFASTTAQAGTCFSGGDGHLRVQALFQQGLLIFITAFCTLLFAHRRVKLVETDSARGQSLPILLVSIKVFGRAMRSGSGARSREQVYSLIHRGIAALPLIRAMRANNTSSAALTPKLTRQYKMSQHSLEVFIGSSFPFSDRGRGRHVVWRQTSHRIHPDVGRTPGFWRTSDKCLTPQPTLAGRRRRLQCQRKHREVFEILDTRTSQGRPAARPVRTRGAARSLEIRTAKVGRTEKKGPFGPCSAGRPWQSRF